MLANSDDEECRSEYLTEDEEEYDEGDTEVEQEDETSESEDEQGSPGVCITKVVTNADRTRDWIEAGKKVFTTVSTNSATTFRS